MRNMSLSSITAFNCFVMSYWSIVRCNCVAQSIFTIHCPQGEEISSQQFNRLKSSNQHGTVNTQIQRWNAGTDSFAYKYTHTGKYNDRMHILVWEPAHTHLHTNPRHPIICNSTFWCQRQFKYGENYSLIHNI